MQALYNWTATKLDERRKAQNGGIDAGLSARVLGGTEAHGFQNLLPNDSNPFVSFSRKSFMKLDAKVDAYNGDPNTKMDFMDKSQNISNFEDKLPKNLSNSIRKRQSLDQIKSNGLKLVDNQRQSLKDQAGHLRQLKNETEL